MRAYLFLVILPGLPAIAQTETNIACVERLEIPTYPVLAKQARISGTLTTTLQIGPDGSAEKISSEWSQAKFRDLIVPGAEKSLRASSFYKACAGKQVKFIFNFVLGETSAREPTISFGYPNQFWIRAPYAMVQP